MASINPTVDAIAERIVSLQTLIAQLDGAQPITVSVGGASVVVDPGQMADTYHGGVDFLRNAFNRAIVDGRSALADATLAIVAEPPAS